MSPQESSTVSSRIHWANEEGNYARSWQTSASKNSSLKTLELAAPGIGNPDRWLHSRLEILFISNGDFTGCKDT